MKSLDLRSADETLEVFSRRFHDEGVGAEACSKAFADFDPSHYDADTLEWAKLAWQGRTLDEYRSQVGFTEFLSELTELGCSFDILSTAVRVVRDESRHVELCKRMVEALGGDGVIPGEPNWVRSDPEQPLLERVMRSTIGSLCIGETLSMALLAATLKVTKEPIAIATVTVLASDESIHSQFGWRLLAQLWPVAGKKLQKKLISELPPLFEAAHEAVFEGALEEGRDRNPFGDLLAPERRATYAKSLERDVLRRFDALKIPARAQAKRAKVL